MARPARPALPPSQANPLPAKLRRLEVELAALRFDLAEVQGISWVEDS